jgi:pyridoxamine 5'-phosphate oxidase
MDYSLSQINTECWNALAKSCKGQESQYITVCNYAAGYINAYTVVLREVSTDQQKIIFYTDVRSNKVGEIATDNRLTIVSYNQAYKVQITLAGNAVIHHQNEVTKRYWYKNGFKGRRSYIAQPGPSTVIEEPTDGLAYLSGKEFNDEDDFGIENFTVVEVTISYLEYLKLSREGNRRAMFTKESYDWKGSWLIP